MSVRRTRERPGYNIRRTRTDTRDQECDGATASTYPRTRTRAPPRVFQTKRGRLRDAFAAVIDLMKNYSHAPSSSSGSPWKRKVGGNHSQRRRRWRRRVRRERAKMKKEEKSTKTLTASERSLSKCERVKRRREEEKEHYNEMDEEEEEEEDGSCWMSQSQPHSSTRAQTSAQNFTSRRQPLTVNQTRERNIVALDCEMVGCIPGNSCLDNQTGSSAVSIEERYQLLLRGGLGRRKKGLKEESVAGRCAIVDYDGKVIYDSFIKPDRRILTLRTFVSGITQQDMDGATPIQRARQEIQSLLAGKLVVAHDIQHDLNALGINLPRELIRDTSVFNSLRRQAGLPVNKIPALRRLAQGILGEIIQQGAHSPVVDARMCMRLYRAVEAEWA